MATNEIKPYDEDKYTSRRDYVIKTISSVFGKQNSYSGSADWGGMPVWTVKGDLYEGTFIVTDDDDNVILMTRQFDEESEENIDEDIMKAEWDDPEFISKLLNKAQGLKTKKEMEQGGKINSTTKNNTMSPEQIQKLVAAANSTNAVAKEIGTKKLKELGLDKNGKPLEGKPASAKKANKKAPAKKSAPAKSAPASDDDYDCDKIIAAAKERKAKAKKSAEKSANKPAVTKATEKVERTHDAIEKQIEAGKLKRAQIEKIIAETKDLLKMLEKALKSL